MRGPAAAALGLTCALLIAGCGSGSRTAADVDWPEWGNGPDNTHYAALAQVDVANVARLKPAWSRAEGPEQFAWETFPVVVGRTMYYSGDDDSVHAVDAASGRERWSFLPRVDFLAGPQGLQASPVSRGVTVAAGRVYELTFDDQLIALDAAGGRQLWSVRIADPAAGYSETSPPAYWNGELIVGGPAGDGGLRGFLAAFSARDGRTLWRTYTVPAPGHGWNSQPGSHGGGDVWMTPTVEPATGTVYAGTGNPTPAFSVRGRPGCNRWTDATVALDARTGRLLWGHSEVCSDAWDYDTDQSPMVIREQIGGQALNVIGDGNKSGFYSLLDGRTGQLLARSPYLTHYSVPHRVPSPSGALVCPGIFGGLEYGPPAYSPRTGEIYLPGTNMCMRYTVNGRRVIDRHRPGAEDLQGEATQAGPATGIVAAVSARTGRLRWRTRLPAPAAGGALATAGGLVFAGDDDGYLYALDDASGAVLWRRYLGLRFGSAPIAYTVDGIEYLAVAAGGSQIAAAAHASGGGRLFVFRLGRA